MLSVMLEELAKYWGKGDAGWAELFDSREHSSQEPDGPPKTNTFSYTEHKKFIKIFPGYPFLLWRQEYTQLLEHLSGISTNRYTRTVVLVGDEENFFIYCALIRRILDAKPTIFQHGTLIVQFAAGQLQKVEPSHPGFDSMDAWTLIVPNSTARTPHDCLLGANSNHFTLMSVNQLVTDCQRAWAIDEHVHLIAARPWEWAEIHFINSYFDSPYEDRLLHEAFTKFGPLLTKCIRLLRTPGQLKIEECIVMSSIFRLSDEVLQQLLTGVPLSFTSAPMPLDLTKFTFDSERRPITKFVTPHVVELVHHELNRRKIYKAGGFFNVFTMPYISYLH